MVTSESGRTSQRSWLVGLAVLSIVVPLVAVLVRSEPVGAPDDAARVSYYRQTVAALAVGIACAVGTLVGIWRLQPAWLRWLGVGLAVLGLLIGAYLLISLVGLCGAGVLAGACSA